MKGLIRSGVSLAAAGMLALAAGAAEHEMTMTGCLESAGDGYALVGADGRTELTGAADFAKHEGHTVKVTGEHTGTMMTVSELEHISPECDPTKAVAVGKPGAAERARDAGPTADDQGGSPADRETTAQIRRAIVEDDSLSVAAHNVKIVTRDGKVTLRGEVRSAQEKETVVGLAKAVASDVDDQLTVRPE